MGRLNSLRIAAAAASLGVACASPRFALADVTTNVPEAAGYTVIYDLNIPNAASFNSAAIPYTTNLSGSGYGTFSRVGYYLELQSGSNPTQYVYASFNAAGFTFDPKKLGIPNTAAATAIQQRVTGMNVVSNVSGITTGTGIATGNVEFWPTDYTQGNGAGIPGAAGNAYDFGDSRSATGNHGSFQIHNYGAGQTLLAYNNWGAGGANNSSLGIGTQTSGSPDWTFANNAATYNVKRLQVVVGGPASPLAPNAPAALVAKAPELATYKLVHQKAITANSNLNNNGPGYTQDFSGAANLAPGTWDRVAYFLELTDGTGSRFVNVSFDAAGYTTDPTKIGIPVVSSGAAFRQGVSNMNITSDAPNVTNGTGLSGGNIEFWPSNYGTANDANVPGASGTTHDFGDGGNDLSAGYGSMQIHNAAAGQTVLAYNAWGNGEAGDLGIGNRGTSHPDWTFAANAGSYSVKNLYVLVHPVPEPATLGLAGAGAMGLLLRRRRR